MAVNQALLREAQATGPTKVPVARPRLPSAEAVFPYLQRIDDAGWYSNFGPLLTEFEARLAGRFPAGTEVVTVTNATQALTLTLMAMNLPVGGYVVMPAWTFVATAHAVVQAGLKPWFADVDPDSWMLRPEAVTGLAADIRAQVVAVIPVSAFGAAGDLAAWRAFRDETGVPVLVDAAAAFDTLDDADLPAVVSLHATKVLGIGEGGFLATRDAALALRVRQLTTFGFQGGRESHVAATNAKLSEYPAAVGLASLDAWPADRFRFLRAAQQLRISLIGRPEVQFQNGWGADWVTSVCAVGLPDGMAAPVADALHQQGIDTRQWWGAGCHTSPAFADCARGDLRHTDRLAGSVIGLPFSIDLSAAETGRITDALQQALAGL
ncbi:DegT/DnrJ/EryC1/StrS family aminotransferase [Brevundimonas sp.]|uniref:DegT/DnrJ/EryC1/StrS family aminotransferase n=1 Tax=Brevundimonas sp. TaxID=1871086 RepID=UPI0024884A02|nr:DegT/DnrJ/EryC1/StrS family aminotransferase [Brevundimonas sp.]MDI1282343.1 DegT/DnrJ/EryC1/StrS family aminotransferase [Brevundimonas sp.]